jgi:hypothetical protein
MRKKVTVVRSSIDVNKTLYNKMQLMYLKNRIDAAASEVMERWDDKHPEPDEASDDEKYDQIVRGEATLINWAHLQRNRGMTTDLEDAYLFIDPRKQERDEWKEQRDAFERKLAKMKSKAEELIYMGDQTTLLTFINTIEDMQP